MNEPWPAGPRHLAELPEPRAGAGRVVITAGALVAGELDASSAAPFSGGRAERHPSPVRSGALTASDDLEMECETGVTRPQNPQLSASSSDRGSDGSGPHSALSDLAATWGLGGVLAQLEQLTVEHGAMPREADDLRVALAMFVRHYAPPASAGEAFAWRDVPCPPCAGELASLQRYLDGGEVRRG